MLNDESCSVVLLVKCFPHFSRIVGVYNGCWFEQLIFTRQIGSCQYILDLVLNNKSKPDFLLVIAFIWARFFPNGWRMRCLLLLVYKIQLVVLFSAKPKNQCPIYYRFGLALKQNFASLCVKLAVEYLN